MTITERRRRTRASLQEAAIAAFAAHGVEGASIEEICAAGGFTRGAFYSNFATKDELVLAIVDSELDDLVEGISDFVAAADQRPEDVSTPEARREAVRTSLRGSLGLRHRSAHWQITMREIQLYALRHRELLARVDELRRARDAELRAVIEQALLSYGARCTIELDRLVDICRGTTDAAADAALAQQEGEEIDIDIESTALVIEAFLRFPDGE